jgi:hypothetical protein
MNVENISRACDALLCELFLMGCLTICYHAILFYDAVLAAYIIKHSIKIVNGGLIRLWVEVLVIHFKALLMYD